MLFHKSLPVLCAALALLALGQLEACGQGPATSAPLQASKENEKAGQKPASRAASLSSLLHYEGAFRAPPGKFGASEFNYGGTAIAYNSANRSLFIVGHDHDQAIAEISIPKTIVNSDRLGDLATASVLQPFVRVLTKVPDFSLSGNVKVGGLMVVDDKLIGTAYIFYDADGKAMTSHFQLDSLELSSAKVEGFFRVGKLGGGLVGGYMAPIPIEWQRELGARYVTGQAALAIIGRTSSGPAAFGFDPKDFSKAPAPATPYVYYPLSQSLGRLVGPTNGWFNGATLINGVCFVPGSRTVLFFGSSGLGEIGYGEAKDSNDSNRSYRGYHARDGKYEYQVWAYDVHDLIAVKNKKKQPWTIKPYDVWHLRFPIDDGAKRIGGVAFDRDAGRLYVSQLGGARGQFEYAPLIHVFKVQASAK